MTLVHRILDCNRCDWRSFTRFYARGRRIGWLRGDVAALLIESQTVVSTENGLMLPGHDEGGLSCSAERVHRVLAEHGICRSAVGEACPVRESWSDAALFDVDRSAMIALGIRGYGIHVNAYVRRAGKLSVWIARRAAMRVEFPSLLDTTVGGALPSQASVGEWLLREAADEAGLPSHVASRAIATGATAYAAERGPGVSRCVQLCFDLELEHGIEPRPCDSEVEGFELMQAERLLEHLETTDDFKPSSGLVLIDFLIRHGVIEPGREDFMALVEGVRMGLREP